MRRRISWLVLATTSAVVVAFVIPLCLLVRTLAQDRAMSAADQEGRNVAILVASLPDDEQLDELVTALDARAAPETGVLTATGRELGAGGVSADDPEVQRALAGEAFTIVDGDGGRALLPVVGPDGTAVVRTTVTSAELRRGVAPAWAGILGLGLVLLLGALAISTRLGRRVSDPVRAVARTAHRLREGDLTARAPISGTEETVELAEALNGLAERTTELLASERASVADLSHRLRTPVTALRLDSEAVTDPELSQRLVEHVANLQRAIDAILAEARRPVRSDLPERCDAIAVLRERTSFWAALAEEQDRPLAVDLPDYGVSVGLATRRPRRPGRRPHRQRLRPHSGRHRAARRRRARRRPAAGDQSPTPVRASRVRRPAPAPYAASAPPVSAWTSCAGRSSAAAAPSGPGRLPRAAPWSCWSCRSAPETSVVTSVVIVVTVVAVCRRRGRRHGRRRRRRHGHRRGRRRRCRASWERCRCCGSRPGPRAWAG